MGNSGSLGNLQSQISADKARLNARNKEIELKESIRREEERFKNESGILLLKFSDNTFFLLSHLQDSTLKSIESAIEDI